MNQKASPREGKTLRVAAWTACALFGSSFALAQSPAATSTSTDTPQKLETFVVTGSYLPMSAEVNASPILTIERADIGQSGTTVGNLTKLGETPAGNPSIQNPIALTTDIFGSFVVSATQLLDRRIRHLVRAGVEQGELVAHARSIASRRIFAAGESTSGKNAVSSPIAGRNAQTR